MKLETPVFLVASPLMEDYAFIRSVVLLAKDEAQGSLGFTIVHKFGLLMDFNQALLDGGPVSLGDYFIAIHTPDWQSDNSVSLGEELSLSPLEDILDSLSKRSGPRQFQLLTGYAGWESGELAEELKQGYWLSLPYSEDLLFEIEPKYRWAEALSRLGIPSAANLSVPGNFISTN